MNNLKRLALLPALAVTAAGLSMAPAGATTDGLSPEAIDALAVASCQLDAANPLALEELAPEVLGTADVDVVTGEITVHVVRAKVNTTTAGDPQQCTFGVLHRDAQLKQVQHVGNVSLDLVDLVDSVPAATYGAVTEIGLGNMGKSSPIDPTTEVALIGFLSPLEVDEDPTYTVTLTRKSLQEVQVGASHAETKAAARLLKKQLKAAAQLEKKQLKAAHAKHSEKAAAAAKASHDRRVAAAQRAYAKATSPKTILRPVGVAITPVSGSVLLDDVL